MKTLYESIFDDDDIINNADDTIKKQIINFLIENYNQGIWNDLNENQIKLTWKQSKQKYIVTFENIDGIYVKKPRRLFMDSLNCNDLFEFGDLSNIGFFCYECFNLKTLEGAPKKVSEFNCSRCDSLNDLIGAPKKVSEFNCEKCANLKTLKGAPTECHKFSCNGCNSLKNLMNAPKKVYNFNCEGCKNLQSLTGAPRNVEGTFNCEDCTSLKSLKGAPIECNMFDCSYCHSLKDLTGSPKTTGKFICSYCRNLTSLKGAPKKVNYAFDCEGCLKLTSLKGAPEEVMQMFCWRCINIKKIDWYPTKLSCISHSGLPEDELKELIDKTGAENIRK